MTINSMHQLMGAIQKNPQAVGEAVANGVGAGFEELLHQASQNDRPANNSQSNKQQPAKDQKPVDNDSKPEAPGSQTNQSGKQQVAAEKPVQPVQDQDMQTQQALAAALVTPVMQALAPVENLEAEPVVALDSAAAGFAVSADPETVANGQAENGLLPQTEQANQQLTGLQQQTAGNTQQTELPPQAAAMTNTQTAGEPQANGLQDTVNQQAGQLNNTQQTADTTANNAANQQQGQAEEGSEEAAGFQTQVFGNNDAVPVKVSDAAPEKALEPQADNAADQLAQRINQALAQGESRVTLNLTPANLGSLTVEISRLSDGTLHILLSAVTEKAAGLLDKHSGSLQSLLAGNMPGTVRVEVENRMSDANQQQFLNPDQQQEQSNQQESREQQRRSSDEQQAVANIDFMQQLRLGLVDLQEQ